MFTKKHMWRQKQLIFTETLHHQNLNFRDDKMFDSPFLSSEADHPIT